MVCKGKAILALLLLAAQGAGTIRAQANNKTTTPAQSTSRTSPASAANPSSNAPSTSQPASPEGSNPNCAVTPCDEQPSHIAIATPAPAPAPWVWQDRVAWAANILLAIFAYAGVMIGLSTLKKIARQTEYVETAAQAAADSAQAALLHAQAIIRAERPWILISVEPSRSVENGFTVTATNRGRGPARIVSTIDKITSAVDQSHLPDQPEYDEAAPSAALSSVVLLPGESTAIKSFSRDEVKNFCGSDEKLKRVEKWEELILLYGRVQYKDLVAAGDGEAHESSWCCWYIHGRQKSGMVMAGPPAYNRHT
ncbi:MAG TPA: hypothetical protein VL986_08510 [Terracidiphilus sp.]|nr:hypothetical protein [Terracidiphilus sp.]